MASTRTAVGANVSIVMCPSLHPAGINARCEELFDRLNYGPLTKFFKEDGGREAFAAYADVVIGELLPLVQGIPEGSKGDCIALFGHAVFHNAVAYRIAGFWGLSGESLTDLEELDLGESEGLWITNSGGATTVRHLHTRALAAKGVTSHPLFA